MDKKTLNSMLVAERIAAVTENPDLLRYIDNPQRSVQLAAVKSSPWALQYIENPDSSLLIAAIGRSPSALKYIKNPAEYVLEAFAERWPEGIRDIESPSEKLQLAAVRARPRAIRFIQHPTKAVQVEAVTREPDVLKYIENPCQAAMRADITRMSTARQMAAVRADWQRIRQLDKPAESVQIAALSVLRSYQLDERPTLPAELLVKFDLTSTKVLDALLFNDPLSFRNINLDVDISLRHKVLAEARAQTMHETLFSGGSGEWAYTPEINSAYVAEAVGLVLSAGGEPKMPDYADQLVDAYLRIATGVGIDELNQLDDLAKIDILKKAPWAIQFITQPTEAVQLAVVPLLDNLNDWDCARAWETINLIDAPCHKLQLYALLTLSAGSSKYQAKLLERLSPEVKTAYLTATTALGIDPSDPGFKEIFVGIYEGLVRDSASPTGAPGIN